MVKVRYGAAAAALITAAALVVQTPSAGAASAAGIPGFTAAHARWEQRYEDAFKKIPSTSVAHSLDAYLSRTPGLVATSGDYRRVRYTVNKLRSYGLRPQVHTYYTYLSEPRSISVQLVAPTRKNLPVKEHKQPWDHDYSDVVVGYNALSPSGDVTAPVVYANYGRPEDFTALQKAGVSVKGKIVLVRYGGNFRGVKTREAYLRGAKAVVIYSDPADDGYGQGPVYPDGPWRAADGIQRGSVGQIMYYTGDPLTPGWASTKNARRLKPSQAKELAPIPTTPISYGAAKPLLAALTGPKAPKDFQGGLPLTYRLGPGPTKVHLDLKIHYATKPIWDVTATIPGSTDPGHRVLIGAHRDAWVYGSDDNLSGAENVLQVARGLGALLKKGWRPRRTITLASWDGEEYGLYGSTEYAEQRGAGLDHTVAYLNMDIAAGRYFGASASPDLDSLIYQTTKQVEWPGSGTTLYNAWRADSGGKQPQIARLGSGSDYTTFYQRYGVPSFDLGASTPSGDYHCACDDNYMETHFIDPGWHYHVAMSQLVGITTLRLANADEVPLRYAGYAGVVRGYLTDFVADQRSQLGSVPVPVDRDVRQTRAWARAAGALQRRADAALRRGDQPALRRINRALLRGERTLLTGAGLPDRAWYRHQIYAPGFHSGYGTQPLPALHDALLSDHHVGQAKAYEARLYRSLRAATASLHG